VTDSSTAGEARPDGYRRDAFTWATFGALVAFGFLNAVLGPALPYLRAVEHISYVVGALHQVAFAVGGGLAGLLAARRQRETGRATLIRLGLVGAALAGLGLGYGDQVAVTVVSAFFVSLLGTSALVRLWAALADAQSRWRTVAMTEGEVCVSLGGIIAPLLVGGLAGTALGWRFAFVLGGAMVLVAVLGTGIARFPPSSIAPVSEQRRSGPRRRRRPSATLVIVFAIVALEFSLSFWLASYLHDSVGLDRALAATMVSGLYAANLAGRVLTSRLARRLSARVLLMASLIVSLLGMPVLLTATGAITAAVGLLLVGAGIGALFPLTSSIHVASNPGTADSAMGQVLAVAAIGQVVGPLAVGVIAQSAGLRLGLVVLPVLALVAASALARHSPADAT
jgi:fucose permease